MTYVGGKRDRLIVENVKTLIEDSLDDLGWFDSGRNHRDVSVRAKPIDADEEIMPNVVAISDEDIDSFEMELGSLWEEYRWQFYIDIYAESQALGRHLAGDIRAILKGILTEIDRGDGPILSVLDLTMATPTEIFVCQIEDIVSSRQRFYTKPFEKFWWTIGFTVLDEHGDDTE